ncbi:MAG: hypothetical protein R3A79_28090 [Nannocystaceae bacterium]
MCTRSRRSPHLRRPRRLAVAAVALLAALAPACARRQALDAPALTRLRAVDPELRQLRVYLDHRLVVVYPDEEARSLAVRRGVVEEATVAESLRHVVRRRSAGAVIAATDDGRGLWVSFDPACETVDCAFHFIAAGDDAFALAEVPARAGRGAPEPHRGRVVEGTRLRPQLVDPQVSAAQILAVPRRRGSVPVGLELRRRAGERERVDTERARGFDRADAEGPR